MQDACCSERKGKFDVKLALIWPNIFVEERRRRRMQDAELYASSNQMQRRDASIVLAAHLPVMTWKEGHRPNLFSQYANSKSLTRMNNVHHIEYSNTTLAERFGYSVGIRIRDS
jgi:hypothetical protein